MAQQWERSCQAFGEAAAWFVASVAEVGDGWSLPALGEWDVRDLVGHTSRSLLTVEAYLAKPAARVDLESATAYYAAARAIAAGPDVAQRGRDAGAALGADPASAVAAIAERVVPLVVAADADALLTTVAGGMRLRDYLPTRTFELVVHTADLAVALGLPLDVPALPAAQALEIVSDLAITGGLAGQVLLAATGRSAFPAGISVL